MLMKKIITRQLIVCIVITWMSNFSFTSAVLVQISNTDNFCSTDKSICGTAPEEMTLLMDFVREMTNSIKTIGTEWEYVGQYVNPNRFKWTVFAPPQQTVLTKLGRNVLQKIKFWFATTAIFTTPVNFAWGRDILWWTVLLSKNQVFLRDVKLVEELESLLSTKKYELGLWGWWYDKIDSENLAVMKGIIDKYQQEKLFSAYELNNGTLYNNVTSLLTKMLSAAKGFLYFDRVEQFDEIERWGDNGIQVFFDDAFKTNVRVKYSCARGINNPCNPVLKEFWKNITNIVSNGLDSAAKSIETFGDAGKRLAEVFKKNPSDEYKAREADLLRSMYGTTKVSTSTWLLKWLFIDPFKKTWESVKKSASEVAQDTANGRSTVSKFWQFPKNVKDAVTILPKPSVFVDLTTVDTSSDNYSQLLFTKMMEEYINDVLIAQQTEKNLAVLSDVQQVTPAFTVLWEQIYTTKEKILDDTIKNLSTAAQKQCSE